MNMVSWLLERTLPYRLCQAPFAEVKFEPILRHNNLAEVGRVLDVACGPGTNTGHFCDVEYLGIDINTRYIAHARRRYGARFRVADVTSCEIEGHFDFILVNSFLHHVPDGTARSVLEQLHDLLSPAGHIHILDLVRPTGLSVARVLARLDRGAFARPLEQWRLLFSERFREIIFQPYSVRCARTDLWNMVYFKGVPRG